MILLDKTHNNHTYKEFEAKIKILHHPTTIKENYETTIHCDSTKQIARIIKINKDCLKTGDISIVKFRLKKILNSFRKKNKLYLERDKQKELV